VGYPAPPPLHENPVARTLRGRSSTGSRHVRSKRAFEAWCCGVPSVSGIGRRTAGPRGHPTAPTGRNQRAGFRIRAPIVRAWVGVEATPKPRTRCWPQPGSRAARALHVPELVSRGPIVRSAVGGTALWGPQRARRPTATCDANGSIHCVTTQPRCLPSVSAQTCRARAAVSVLLRLRGGTAHAGGVGEAHKEVAPIR